MGDLLAALFMIIFFASCFGIIAGMDKLKE